MVHLIRREHAQARAEAPGLDSVLDGIRFIRNRPAVLGAISLDLFAVLLGGATALLPAYARDILVTGPRGSDGCGLPPRSARWQWRFTSRGIR